MEFSLAEDAREAIDNMDQAELYGRVIKCNQAKPQKDASEGLGSRTAVWEQVCIRALIDSNFQLRCSQEGYASKYNMAEDDGAAAEDGDDKPMDPMQGLEGLDVAGPRMQAA